VGAAEKIRFASSILPKWARRTKSLDALLPILYLRDISTGDFQETLAATCARQTRSRACLPQVRHRTVRTKGLLSPRTAKLMVFKLVAAVAKTWRRLKEENQLPKVVRGVKFQNGVEVIEMPADHAA
jgi:hypothetical protein